MCGKSRKNESAKEGERKAYDGGKNIFSTKQFKRGRRQPAFETTHRRGKKLEEGKRKSREKGIKKPGTGVKKKDKTSEE